jgi:hypothetical protein
LGQDNKERNRKLVEEFTSKALEANLTARTVAEELEKQQEASLTMKGRNAAGMNGPASGGGSSGGGVDPASLLAANDEGKIVFTPTHEFSSRLEITLLDRKEVVITYHFVSSVWR